MTRYLKLAILLLFSHICGIAAAGNSTVLDRDGPPIREVAIIVGMGSPAFLPVEMRSWYSQQLKEAIKRRLPEIFAVNGIKVASITVADAFQVEEPEQVTGEDGPSHYLVLNASEYSVGSGKGMTFATALWNAREQKKVWTTYSNLGLLISQPLLRTQLMAAELLRKLRDDKMLSLPAKNPIDMAGEPITSYWMWTEDR
jgi:hypothetical protein